MKTNSKKSNRLPRVRSAIYGQPWMITPDWLEAICEIFERNVALEKIEFEAAQAPTGPGSYLSQEGYSMEGNVAILPLMGPIFPRANLMTRMSGATSIEDFGAQFRHAMANPDVDALLVHIDSPGGSVSGIFEQASEIFSARIGHKPVVGMIDGMGCSAAYLIGSQCDTLYATEASVGGSIGVVMSIEDDTRQSENDGIKRTIIKTGPLKAVGVGPVTDEQVKHMQSLADDFFGKFKSAVARARPFVNLEATATGEVWIGKKLQDLGLVDGITTLPKLLADWS